MKQAQYDTGEADNDAIREDAGSTLDMAFLRAGNARYDLDLKEATLAAYEEAILLAPQEAILHFHKGHALKQLGRVFEAERSYEDARRLGYNG
jgi:Flp pilus assembly protein TadD